MNNLELFFVPLCRMNNLVRIGIIGLGQRGMATLRRYEVIGEAQVVALADLSATRLDEARRTLEQQGRPAATLYEGEGKWKDLCQDRNVDLVCVCTDWASHARIGIYAMQQGKNVALEVPAATTVSECRQLVDTAKATGRYCTMLENCCYDTFHLGLMQMVQQGLFGEITHCEGAYIHDLRTDLGWVSYTVFEHMGNPYPTHGLGPACQLLDINRSDRLVSLVSMSALNKINNTLLRTRRGRTILLQFDERTPRPYSRIQTLCATQGYAQKYPLPTLQLDGQQPLQGKEAQAAVEAYHDAETRQLIAEGRRLGVGNLMNYIMDRRLVSRLTNGLAPDISVYDAAVWSCVAELTARSAERGGALMEIPDFT